MSLMIPINDRPELRAVFRRRCCSSSNPLSWSNPMMPSTPLSGVRISWLIMARKLAFA